MIALPPRAVVATADAAALVVLVVPYPTALDREVGGVEELAVARGVSVEGAYVLAQDPECGRRVHPTDRARRRQ